MRPLLTIVAAALGDADCGPLTFHCTNGIGGAKERHPGTLPTITATALDGAVRDWLSRFQAESKIDILALDGGALLKDVAAMVDAPDVPMAPLAAGVVPAMHARPPAFWKGRGVSRFLAHASIPWDYDWCPPSPVRVTASDLHADPGARKTIAARWTKPIEAWFEERRRLFRGIVGITFAFGVDPPSAHQRMAAFAARARARASGLKAGT